MTPRVSLLRKGYYNCDKCYACEKSCPVNIQIVHSIEKLQQSGRKSEDRKVKELDRDVRR